MEEKESKHAAEEKNLSEEVKRSRKMARNLFIRNILNTIFILLAIISMIGVIACGNEKRMIWYFLAMFAVIIKMIEAMLRMPGFKK